jgi:hypothetical protein
MSGLSNSIAPIIASPEKYSSIIPPGRPESLHCCHCCGNPECLLWAQMRQLKNHKLIMIRR